MRLKEIPGFDGYYGVTRDGQVWSYLSERFLTFTPDLKGYYRVGLYKDGIYKVYLVHRLVMTTWGDLNLNDTKTVVHHIDGDPLNNKLENLQIMSDYEHHAYHNHINAKGYNIDTNTHKLCTKCGILKLRDEFSVSQNCPDGLCDQCKSCRNEYYQQNCDKIKEYYQQNYDKITKYKQKYYQQNKIAINQRKRERRQRD